jgi:acetyltransferase-like isoleucine patch superfamily enzyme
MRRRTAPGRARSVALLLVAWAAGGCGPDVGMAADHDGGRDALAAFWRGVCTTANADALNPGTIDEGETVRGDAVSCEDIDVEEGAYVDGNVVAGCDALYDGGSRVCRGDDGDLDIEEAAVIEGHAVARGDVDLEEGVAVVGCVVAWEDVDIDRDVWIGGSVIAHGDVEIDGPAIIEGDVCIHGDGELDCDGRATIAGIPCRAYRPRPLSVCAAACLAR